MSWTAAMLPPFRDEEAEVATILETFFTGDPAAVLIDDRTPDDLEAILADGTIFVRLGRVGGAPDRTEEHTDKPVVDVDVFGLYRTAAKSVAQLIEQLLMSKPHPIDECDVLMSPQRVEWVDGSPVRRFYASYHLSLRR